MISSSSSVSEISCVNLHENVARDYLAALGMLRLVQHLWPEKEPRLAWEAKQGYPKISTITPLSSSWPSIVVSSLQNLEKDPAHPLKHGKKIKTECSNFRTAVLGALAFAKQPVPLAGIPALLYASYSSQLSGEEENFVDPTRLSFGNDQSGKNLLLDVCELIAGLDADEFLESLLGNRKPVAKKSLRWNPVEFRPSAYRSHDPVDDKHLDQPTHNVLAFIGLTFYPTVPSSVGVATLGFPLEHQSFFHWPIWGDPLTTDEVTTLVHQLPCIDGEIDRRVLCGYGAKRIWRSRRFSSDKSLYFAPAELVG
jgi:hypothetical protein